MHDGNDQDSAPGDLIDDPIGKSVDDLWRQVGPSGFPCDGEEDFWGSSGF